MTPMQIKFAQLLIDGINPSQAYGQAGYAINPSNHVLAVDANNLKNHPEILLMVAAGNKAIQDAGLLSRQDAIKEAKVNMAGARLALQWGPANGALKQAVELSGLASEPERQGDIHITKVTVVLSGQSVPGDAEVTVDAVEWSEVPEQSEDEEEGP